MQTDVVDLSTGELTVPFEQLCDEAREAADDMDAGRWTIGRLAAEVETKYKAHNIADMAREIGIEKARIWEYERVHKFYEKLADANYRGANPMLRYSHFRMAMRLKEATAAMAFLDECSTDGLTIEQAGIKLTERLGKPTPARKVIEFECAWDELYNNLRAAMLARGADHPARVRLTVTEATQ